MWRERRMFGAVVTLGAILGFSVVSVGRSESLNWREGCIWWRKPDIDNDGVGENDGENLTGSSRIGGAQSDFMLDCHVRSLNGEFWSSSSFAGQQHSSTRSLRVRCHDKLFFQSYLPPLNETLNHLSSLESIQIESCKIKKMGSHVWEGLTGLKELKIHSKNIEWGSGISLQLETGAFHGLNSLKELDLSHNNLWDFGSSNNNLCGLERLERLNLSSNSIVEFLQLQKNDRGNDEGSGCHLRNLKMVDLSSNKIRRIENYAFFRARDSLVELDLSVNLVDQLEDRSFDGLRHLKRLNLTGNRLVAVPPHTFSTLTSLRELYLNENEISALSPSVFSELRSLVALDLSKNQIRELWTAGGFRSPVSSEEDGETSQDSIFSHCTQLVVLRLSYNKISELRDPLLFQSLKKLQLLDLSHNGLEIINGHLFHSLRRLEQLDLSANKLIALSPSLLSNQPSLQQLYLDHNELTGLPSSIFNNCSDVKDLGLAANKFTHVPAALRALKKLVTLDVGENEIQDISIHNDTFDGLVHLDGLMGLRLVDNKLKEIPKGFCRHLRQLRVLNLADNEIEKLYVKSFEGCKEVRALRLDGNSLTGLTPSLSSEMPGLLWLNVSRNKISSFDYVGLSKTVEWLDLSYNELKELVFTTSQNDRKPWNLRVLDASHNYLESVTPTSFPQNIEKIRINDNKIIGIAPNTFSRFPSLLSVDLTGNELTSMDLSALRVVTKRGRTTPTEFYLRNNPFVCDCGMEWLKDVNGRHSYYGHVVDLHTLVCPATSDRNVSMELVPLMEKNDWLCNYKSHCPLECYCCDFDACDCEMICPDGCTCSHNAAWTLNTVSCNNRSELPPKIPMDASEIRLDGNWLIELPSHGFIGKKNLQSLFLNHSHIALLQNRSFNGLKNLRNLYLHNNQLVQLDGYEFDDTPNLELLHLNHNRLQYIAAGVFERLRYLKNLRLDYNELKSIGAWELTRVHNLRLDNNLWTCDCDFIVELDALKLKWKELQCFKKNEQWLTMRDVKCDKEALGEGKVIPQIGAESPSEPVLIEHHYYPVMIEDHDNNDADADYEDLPSVEGGTGFDQEVRRQSPPPSENVWTPLVIILVFMIVILIVLFVFKKEVKAFSSNCSRHMKPMLCCNSERRKVWSDSNGGGKNGNGATSDESDKLFDAYFLYSKTESEFLVDKISQHLNGPESGESYRLCFHHKDLSFSGLNSPVGSGSSWNWTKMDSDLMKSACQATKRVVILLTPNFLQSMVDSRTSDSGGELITGIKCDPYTALLSAMSLETKVIFILFPPFTPHNLTQILPIHDNMLCLQWDDPLFWKKFKMCLPPCSSNPKSNSISCSSSGSSSSASSTNGTTSTNSNASTLKNYAANRIRFIADGAGGVGSQTLPYAHHHSHSATDSLLSFESNSNNSGSSLLFNQYPQVPLGTGFPSYFNHYNYPPSAQAIPPQAQNAPNNANGFQFFNLNPSNLSFHESFRRHLKSQQTPNPNPVSASLLRKLDSTLNPSHLMSNSSTPLLIQSQNIPGIFSYGNILEGGLPQEPRGEIDPSEHVYSTLDSRSPSPAPNGRIDVNNSSQADPSVGSPSRRNASGLRTNESPGSLDPVNGALSSPDASVSPAKAGPPNSGGNNGLTYFV